jgi:tRNA A64-2'-O-ribosylphosphate transferase
MPDALSKTVPIWCAVLNRIVGDCKRWRNIQFPAESVSPQEAASIEALIPSFVMSFKVQLSRP